MDNVVETLVNEVLTLQAEVAALRVLASAPLADDPVRYLNMTLRDFDAYTLPMVMSEAQREILRERLEHTRDVWVAHMRVAHPGGWRGLRYCLARTLKRIHRAFAGSSSLQEAPPPALRWSEVARATGLAAPK